MSEHPTHKPKASIRWLNLLMAVALAIHSGGAAATAQPDASPPVAPAVSAAPDTEPLPVDHGTAEDLLTVYTAEEPMAPIAHR